MDGRGYVRRDVFGKGGSADIDELSFETNGYCNHLSWEHLLRILNSKMGKVTDLVQIPIMGQLADYTTSLRQLKRWKEEQKNDVQLGTWNEVLVKINAKLSRRRCGRDGMTLTCAAGCDGNGVVC